MLCGRPGAARQRPLRAARQRGHRGARDGRARARALADAASGARALARLRRSPTSPSRTSRARRAAGSRSFACSRSRSASRPRSRSAATRRSPASSRRSSPRIPLRERLGGPADARALPLGAPGRGARGLQPDAEAARRRARHRAEPGAAAARAGDPQPGSVARSAGARRVRAGARRAAHEPAAAGAAADAERRSRSLFADFVLTPTRWRDDRARDARARLLPPRRRAGRASSRSTAARSTGRARSRSSPCSAFRACTRTMRCGRCARRSSCARRSPRSSPRLESDFGVRRRRARSASTPARSSREWRSPHPRWAAHRASRRASGARRRSARSSSRTRRRTLVARAVAADPSTGRPAPRRAGACSTSFGARGVERRLSSCRRSAASEELDALRRAFERSGASAAPSLVTVLGPAGIGKSHLARAFVDGLGDECRVLVGSLPAVRRGKHLRAARGDRSRRLQATSPLDAIRERRRRATTSGRHHRAHRRGDRAVREWRPDRDDVLGGAQAARGARARAAARRRARRPPLGRADVPRSRRVRRRLGVRRADPPARPRPPRAPRRAADLGRRKRNISSVLLEAARPTAESEALIDNLLDDSALDAGRVARGSRDAAGGNPFFLEQMVAMHTVEGRGAARRSRRRSRRCSPPASTGSSPSSTRCSSARRSWARSSGRRARRARPRRQPGLARQNLRELVRKQLDRAVPVDDPGRRCAPLPQRPDPRRRLRVGAEAVAGRAARALAGWLERAVGEQVGPVRGDARPPPRAGVPLLDELGPLDDHARSSAATARTSRPPRAGGRSRAATWPSAAGLLRAPPRCCRPTTRRASSSCRRSARRCTRPATSPPRERSSTRRSRPAPRDDAALAAAARLIRALVEASSGPRGPTRSCERPSGRARSSSRRGDDAGLATAFRMLAWAHGTAGRYGEAAEAAERAIEHADLAGDERQHAARRDAVRALGPARADSRVRGDRPLPRRSSTTRRETAAPRASSRASSAGSRRCAATSTPRARSPSAAGRSSSTSGRACSPRRRSRREIEMLAGEPAGGRARPPARLRSADRAR